MIAYACKNKNSDVRLKSSSGGVFSLLAEQFIDEGGIVIGAAFDGIKLKHIAIDKKEDIYKLRGSKYVQSEVDYLTMKTNKKILFSGTPCQMPINKENNFLVDVVCHGTPRKEIFNEYCKELKIKNINFRDKKNGWENYKVTIESENGKYSQCFWDNVYMRAFIKNLILTEKCFNCIFKNKTNADITLGDFWGIKELYPEFYDNKGISLVIVRTYKGELMFEKIKDRMEYIKIDLEKAIKYNPCICKSSIPHPKKAEFDNLKGNIVERMNKFV